MIFLTVGTQLAFDRLVASVDAWAKDSNCEVKAQAGPTTVKYEHITQTDFLGADEFELLFSSADLIIAHAGMGSILSALSCGKPIIIMPRQASLGEHRNDHQVATAKRFSEREGVLVAWNEGELISTLTRWLNSDRELVPRISKFAPHDFISNLKELLSDT